MHITRLETQQLFDLARDKSVAAREALTATVTDLFFARGDVLTDRERSLMGEILRQLINDIESSVRRALAEKLAHHKDAPRDLILALANDEIVVAQSILMHSDVLRDEELIEIIHHRTLEHQLAVALRKSLNETVSEALVEAGNVDVITALLGNHDARISRETMAYIVEQSQRVDSYQNPLLRRPDLDPNLARRMYWWVSAALRRHILDNFPVKPSEFDDVLEAATGELAQAPAEPPPRRSDQLVDSLAQIETITPHLLVETLRHGEIALFEAMLAKLTNIRPLLIRRLLFERGGEALAIACRVINIETQTFASIYLLSRKARPNEPPPPRGEIARILGFYETMSVDAAAQVVSTWRRSGDFVKAVRQIDKTGPSNATH
ncbi:MAG TPA: DUF2336 domain-containing protein [Stellaceae bacterium]|nr:DUF2336 domain-containing protein [Stellaceae bacterium]